MSDENNKEVMGTTSSKTDEVLKDGVTMEAEIVEAQETVAETDVEMVTLSDKATDVVPKVVTEKSLAVLDYKDFDTPAKMMELGKVLVQSKLVPLKQPEDVVVAMLAGNELGLPFITSISQIYPINGRATLGVHIQKALCIQNGVTFQKTEDAVEIFQFVKADAEGKVVLTEKTVDNKKVKVPVLVSEGTLDEQPKNTKKTAKSIDRRTTYSFSRLIKRPDGNFKEMTATGSFSLREAKEAELLEKDVWIKYWRRMLDARAFTNGVGEIADDITLGLRSPNEVSNTFYVNDKGQEVPVN